MKVEDFITGANQSLQQPAIIQEMSGDPKLENVIFALTVVDAPRTSRIVRSVVLTIRESQYVDAANAFGASKTRILLRHIAPNTFAPVIVQATFLFASAILSEASLSFLGAGVPPDIPTWGNIIGEGRIYFIGSSGWREC